MTDFQKISSPRNKKGEKIDSKPTNKKQNNKIGSPLVDYFSRSMLLIRLSVFKVRYSESVRNAMPNEIVSYGTCPQVRKTDRRNDKSRQRGYEKAK